jgi:protein involved in polysaccharide export with SLBB domain
MRRACLAVLTLAAVTLTAGCAGSSVSGAPIVTPREQSPLAPGDAVRVDIAREPELSCDETRCKVDENGEVTFPRMGPVKVTGLSPDSLSRLIKAYYSPSLRDPAITVTVLRRVNIVGAVQKPGPYLVDPTMRITDAVAKAGGASSEGKLDQVQLRRGGRRTDINLSSDMRLADTPLRSGDELYVPQRGWVSRNTGLVAAGITAATSVIVTLLVR